MACSNCHTLTQIKWRKEIANGILSFFSGYDSLDRYVEVAQSTNGNWFFRQRETGFDFSNWKPIDPPNPIFNGNVFCESIEWDFEILTTAPIPFGVELSLRKEKIS